MFKGHSPRIAWREHLQALPPYLKRKNHGSRKRFSLNVSSWCQRRVWFTIHVQFAFLFMTFAFGHQSMNRALYTNHVWIPMAWDGWPYPIHPMFITPISWYRWWLTPNISIIIPTIVDGFVPFIPWSSHCIHIELDDSTFATYHFYILYIYFLEDMSNYKSYYQYPRHNIIVIP